MATRDLSSVISPFEAEETVRAIYQGAVDAVVVQGRNGPQIVTLSGADEPYRVLVERMSDGAMTMSDSGTLLYVNQRLAEMTGRSIDAMVGTPFSELFEGDCPVVAADRTQPGGTRHECQLARAGEPALPVSVWAGPIALGEQPATLVTITDLSVHRRAEEIAAAERFARSILEQATEAIVVLDRAGSITHASDAAEQLLGSSPLGQRFTASFKLEAADAAHAGLLERSSSNLDSMLATKPFHGIEVRLRAERARDRAFLLSAGPLLDDDKNPVGSIVTLTDITARKRAEEQQTMLVAELNHRVKNILAIVQSVAAQTVRNAASLDTFNDRFGGRLRALALAHDILTKTRWGGVNLTQLLGEIAAPYRERVSLDGPAVLLPSQSVVPLSMVLHELMTNAAKYGALSGTGRIALTWERAEADKLSMLWSESGGPPVAPRSKTGFGTTLIERVLTYDLDGSASLDFRSQGLTCRLEFPIESGKATAEDPPVSAKALN